MPDFSIIEYFHTRGKSMTGVMAVFGNWSERSNGSIAAHPLPDGCIPLSIAVLIY